MQYRPTAIASFLKGSGGKSISLTNTVRCSVSLTAHPADGSYPIHLVSEAAAPGRGSPFLVASLVSPRRGLVVQEARPHSLGARVHAQVPQQAYPRAHVIQSPLPLVRLQNLRQLLAQQTSEGLQHKHKTNGCYKYYAKRKHHWLVLGNKETCERCPDHLHCELDGRS